MNKLQTIESQIYNRSSMWARWMLSAVLLWVFCPGMTASPLPDSLLTRDAIYRYMFVDPGKSRDIIDDMRAHKTLPEWKLDLAEGNLCFSLCLFNKALAFYTRVYKSNAVQANDSLKMVVLTRLIEAYDVKFDEKTFPAIPTNSMPLLRAVTTLSIWLWRCSWTASALTTRVMSRKASNAARKPSI